MAEGEDTKTLWRQYCTDKTDKALRDRLILTYAPLVKYVAGRLGSGLPAHVDETVRQSAASGAAVAEKAGDPGLLQAVQDAFTHGMDTSLLVAAAIAAVGAILAFVLLPARAPAAPVESEPLVLAESGL